MMTLDETQTEERIHDQCTEREKHPHRIANILIVDDDIDAALAVQRTFGQMGCNIEFALDAEEARRKILSGKADIIILDWMLDQHVSADQLVAGAIRRLHKFGGNLHAPRTKIVTHSGRGDDEVALPQSEYFEHIGHWQKPMKYPDLIRQVLKLMYRTGF